MARAGVGVRRVWPIDCSSRTTPRYRVADLAWWSAKCIKGLRPSVPTEMSEHPDASAETAEERAAFVKWAVESASLYAAVCVSSGIITNLRGVLAGPHGQLSESATADFASVVALLSKHGVTA